MDMPMVQMIENYADLTGEVITVVPDRARPGFVTVTVSVTGADQVDEWPNLFAQDVGQTIDLLARQDSAAATLKPGPVRLRVRRSGPGVAFVQQVCGDQR